MGVADDCGLKLGLICLRALTSFALDCWYVLCTVDVRATSMEISIKIQEIEVLTYMITYICMPREILSLSHTYRD